MTRINVIFVLIFIGSPYFLKSQSARLFDSVDFRITPMSSINTDESEISPFFVENNLYFSSVREVFSDGEKRQRHNALYYNIYRAEIDEKGNTVTECELVPGFGQMFHEGPATWCKKTGELFVSVNNNPEGTGLRSKQNVNLRLIIMTEYNGEWLVLNFRRKSTKEEQKKNKGDWVLSQDFSFKNPEYNFAHPAISISGDTLIFSSDMDGGFGKSDLYMSIRVEGEWSEPVNLGKKINTAANEMFPTFGPGGILLFSSDGHQPNYGQLDIFYTTLTTNEKPNNLGDKFNSASDDFGLIIHPSEKFGYFSSNRNSSGKDDIYHVEFFPQMENIR